MADLLIRDIEPQMERQLAERARTHRRSLSEEAKVMLQQSLAEPIDERKMGTALLNLFPAECRGDDLVFEIRGDVSKPPAFE